MPTVLHVNVTALEKMTTKAYLHLTKASAVTGDEKRCHTGVPSCPIIMEPKIVASRAPGVRRVKADENRLIDEV